VVKILPVCWFTVKKEAQSSLRILEPGCLDHLQIQKPINLESRKPTPRPQLGLPESTAAWAETCATPAHPEFPSPPHSRLHLTAQPSLKLRRAGRLSRPKRQQAARSPREIHGFRHPFPRGQKIFKKVGGVFPAQPPYRGEGCFFKAAMPTCHNPKT
jgi:hypothetical protein